MKVYEIVIGESASLARDRWLFEASSVLAAVKKAEAKRRKNMELYRGWIVTSIREVGELAEGK